MSANREIPLTQTKFLPTYYYTILSTSPIRFCRVLVEWLIPFTHCREFAAMTELVKVSDSSPDGENRESSNLSGRKVFLYFFSVSSQRPPIFLAIQSRSMVHCFLERMKEGN